MKQKVKDFGVSILRRKAEELLKYNTEVPTSNLSEDEILKLIHEIEVHQIELELQNEELKLAKERALELASEKYAELYDFAPSGYFTLSREGDIVNLNFAASQLLGKERMGLKNSRFGFFVSDDTKPNFNQFLKNVFGTNKKEICQVILIPSNDSLLYAQLTGISIKDHNHCLVNVADITKLKEAENVIRDLSLIATHTDNQVMIADVNGAIEYVNEAFEKLTGFTLEEVKGKKPGSFLQGAETNPEHIVAMSKGMKKRTAFSQEILNYTRNGEIFWVSTSINPVFNARGELEKFIAIGQNITGRKEAETQREFERRDKEALINSTDDLIWSIKNDFSLIAANKAFLNLMKQKTGYFFRKGDHVLPADLFDPERRSFWLKQYEKALRGKRFLIDTEMQKNKSSEKNYMEINFNPIYVNKKVEGVACFARDITELKKNKEALLDYNKKLQTTQKISKLGYWEYNLETRKLFWSDEVYKIWEADKAKHNISPENFQATIHPLDKPGYDEYIKDANLGKKHLVIKYRIVLESGRIKWIHETGNLITNGKEELIHYEGTVQDITAQKEYENQILNVSERLRNLSAHLQTVQEEERINIAREIHDELGQQLTAIKLDASWLQNKSKNNEKEEKDRMDRLINNINATIKKVRKIATNLRPGILDDLGLEAAIEWQSVRFEEQTGISCILKTSTISDNYEKTVNTAVYRIFQEALTNVTRHANATKVLIKLSEKNSILVLEVLDNGKGFVEIEKNNLTSLGIAGMKERALMINGIFSIKKRKMGGTKVRLVIRL
ncbi:PAS domain-containing sensor histidine kinase [Gillisia limnaea]|uniref:histidine kinase n=1 Tax=Gillisia limnaea (strain DSM 15749 / LMG 21470 / R-8282) TaxID=865937 RepID=H2BW75_GILLR|nr:PAS domain-containing sensor histidine kinase [Gillisia limnaea]EHQ04039.1 putative signal transduction histidine kinase [Gillisia limnaea DSM 15749]